MVNIFLRIFPCLWMIIVTQPFLVKIKQHCVFIAFKREAVCRPQDNLYRKESESHSVMSDSLRPHGLYSLWNSPGQNTGVGSLSLLQRIFPTQGLNPGLPYCRWILNQLSYQGKPRNTGVGSLSLLTQIFLTQESNWGLLHCRWILYQLSYQGSRIGYLTISFLCLKFSNT